MVGTRRAMPAAQLLDGAALFTLTEADMKTNLGISSFGLRRKFTQRIQAIVKQEKAEEARPPPAAAAGGGAVLQAIHGGGGGGAAGVPGAAEGLDEAAVESQLNAEASCIGVCQVCASNRMAALPPQPFQ